MFTMRVLVLDDDPLTAFTLARLFAIRGIQVVSVSSAEAAERSLERERFDAFIVDAQADQAKGLRVIAHARTKDAGISLFVLSDRRPDDPRANSDICYIEKPWDGFFLIDLVRARATGERRAATAPVQDDRPTVQMRPIRKDRRALRDSAGH
jgi:DNA-binding response OmpR family regulator